MNGRAAREGPEPPFFVVGNDRSGTTLLRVVLDRSEEAAVPPESMFLVDYAPVRRRGGLDDPARAARFVEEVWRHPRVRHWNLSGGPPPLPAGLSHAEAYRFAVSAPFLAYARAAGKERFGDKTPAYLHALDELFAVWPEARVVVLVRDARDVALSIRRVPFGPNNAFAAARWWAAGIRAGLEAERRHAGKVLTVRYEDFVSAPETHVRRVCEHVGLGYNSEMLEVERSGPGTIVAGQASWFAGVSGPISSAEVGRWRTSLSPEDRRVVAAVAGDELRALGYEVAEAGAPVGRPRAAAYAGHDLALRTVNAFRLRVLQERGRELPYVLRRKLSGARG
ncbi:MAG TPA: sulfotransferase [Gaiellaceae bacterium]|nr:sulfotransferase [Gaiellaceae bacterium]